ncbi:hypothetical protein SAMN04488245_101148 [Alloyangia pacifica]|uniref:TNase-like domain-containing protein n=1 Tax=Alloyangia pacifica TaxID=311180 RepID=A0A1I6QL60_9RHOB|nr:hypothetical protein SAMN04488245_101148 [Alloyangia pacifica]SFS53237.1 hypothetical protein SAMN04488050_102149 [Alloyangia pacifica]
MSDWIIDLLQGTKIWLASASEIVAPAWVFLSVAVAIGLSLFALLRQARLHRQSQANPWQGTKRGKRTSQLPRRRSAHRTWKEDLAIAAIAFAAAGVFAYGEVRNRLQPESLGKSVRVHRLGVRTTSVELTGVTTHVRDGDTIEVQGVPIRFGSLDCAELGTAEGERASERMRSLALNRALRCTLTGRKSYDREIGECTLSDGRSLANIMIAEGLCRRWR